MLEELQQYKEQEHTLRADNSSLRAELAKVREQLATEQRNMRELIPTAHMGENEEGGLDCSWLVIFLRPTVFSQASPCSSHWSMRVKQFHLLNVLFLFSFFTLELRKQLTSQRETVQELAALLDTAKRSLVDCAKREAELKEELAKAREHAQSLTWQIEDVAISQDAERGEKDEAVEQASRMEEEIYSLQVNNENTFCTTRIWASSMTSLSFLHTENGSPFLLIHVLPVLNFFFFCTHLVPPYSVAQMKLLDAEREHARSLQQCDQLRRTNQQLVAHIVAIKELDTMGVDGDLLDADSAIAAQPRTSIVPPPSSSKDASADVDDRGAATPTPAAQDTVYPSGIPEEAGVLDDDLVVVAAPDEDIDPSVAEGSVAPSTTAAGEDQVDGDSVTPSQLQSRTSFDSSVNFDNDDVHLPDAGSRSGSYDAGVNSTSNTAPMTREGSSHQFEGIAEEDGQQQETPTRSDSGAGENEDEAVASEGGEADGDVDMSKFCTTCEEYGHLAEDCDDDETF